MKLLALCGILVAAGVPFVTPASADPTPPPSPYQIAGPNGPTVGVCGHSRRYARSSRERAPGAGHPTKALGSSRITPSHRSTAPCSIPATSTSGGHFQGMAWRGIEPL